MKIAFFNSSTIWGGTEQVLTNNLKYLDKKRFEVLAFLGDNPILQERLEKSDVRVHKVRQLSISRRNIWQTIRAYFSFYQVFSLCRRLKIDILVFDRLILIPYALLLSRLLKVSFCFYLHVRDLRRRALSWCLKYVHRVIIPSDIVRAELIEIGIDPAKISLVPNGLDLSEFDPEQNFSSPQALSISNDALNIGMFGRFDPVKNHAVAIKALAILNKKIPARLHFFGDDQDPSSRKYLSEIRNQIRTRGMEDQVIFHGFKYDVRPYLARMSVVILPSTSEIFGLIAIEAMAMKKAVIASSISGLSTFFSGQGECFYVEPGAADVLAARIEFIKTNPEIVSKMVESAAVKVSSYFDINRTVRSLEEILSELK